MSTRKRQRTALDLFDARCILDRFVSEYNGVRLQSGPHHHRPTAGGLQTGLRPSKGDMALEQGVWSATAFGGLKSPWNNQLRHVPGSA